MTQAVWQIVVFSEASLWTISRPLLSATLAACAVDSSAWTSFVSQLVGTQQPDVRPRFSSEFDKLMRGITQSLDAPNRERFARAITGFRGEVLQFVRL